MRIDIVEKEETVTTEIVIDQETESIVKETTQTLKTEEEKDTLLVATTRAIPRSATITH